jgi:hypothetical protein
MELWETASDLNGANTQGERQNGEDEPSALLKKSMYGMPSSAKAFE